MKLGNWTQHFLISLHLSRMLGRSIPLRFTSLLAAASCRPGPFPSFTDHCGTWFSVPLHCNFCHLLGGFYGPPTKPSVLSDFLTLSCLQWSFLHSAKAKSHLGPYYTMSWLLSNREIQASWSQTSVSCPLKPACWTTPNRSELSSDCASDSVFPMLCDAVMSFLTYSSLGTYCRTIISTTQLFQ